jgi:preprotein translocase SecF subunit
MKMMKLVKKTNINFVKASKYTFAVSGSLILLCIIMLGIRGKGVLGIDFTGGTSITYNYAKKGNTSAMAKVLKEAGFKEPSVTYKSNVTSADDADREKLEVMLRGDSNETVQQTVGKILADKFPECGILPASAHAQHLDGLIGKEFTKAAVIAIVLALIGIGAYIVLRYEFTYALASVLALFHDVLVVLGIYLVAGYTVGLTTVAAFLTVIGYSINDTVVIFDRIRENNQNNKFNDFASNVNLSINQTLSRTLITTLTTFFVVFILWIAGGPELKEFTLVMMLGVLLGTFSSIFLAGPTVNFLEKLRNKKGAR